MTSKGQVTLPKRFRDYLGLEPGSTVEFELGDHGQVILTAPPRPPKSALAPLRGSAELSMTTDEIMALARGEERE